METIANEIGASTRTVIRVLADLEKRGYITRELVNSTKSRQKHNVYTLHLSEDTPEDENSGSDGGCNKCSCGKNESGVNPEDEINRLTLKVEELSNRNKELYELNKDIQKMNDDLLYRNNSLVKENTSLKAKLDKFKNLLESEF